jgi:hypothetical protein
MTLITLNYEEYEECHASSPRSGLAMAAVIDDDPRELSYRSTLWTAPWLTQYLADHHHIAVSRPSVSLVIARLGLRGKRPRHNLALHPATWRQAKGGSNAAWQRGSGPFS